MVGKGSKTMAKYDPADIAAVEAQVIAMADAAKISGKTTVFFDTRVMFNAMKFSKMTRAQFTAQVAEQLTGSAFHKKYGDWVACEYECEMWVMVRLAAPGDLQAVNDSTRNMFYNTTTRSAKRKQTKTITIDAPADMSADDINAALRAFQDRKNNTGSIADLHNEDLRREHHAN
jgi:hypothetical protein